MKLRVRMYRVGFGDCFLVTVPDGKKGKHILIDCGALKDSTDAAMLASRVDGVVIVVDAGESRREEILNSQRMIQTAGGKLLGFVLNQRRYPVPEWLYKRL